MNELKKAKLELKQLKEKKEIEKVNKEMMEIKKTGNKYLDLFNISIDWAKNNIDKVFIMGVVIYVFYIYLF